ncbi:MAG: cadherin-like beta sandwich domain-containing protein [Treponema sp.]|nr:cadherin-like beta sandwich domain-containing protein [Treponema sp.]
MKHLTSRKSAWAGIISIALLYVACSDTFTIADFIKENTSTAAVINSEIHPNSRMIKDSEGFERLGFKESYNAVLNKVNHVFYIEPGFPADYETPRTIELDIGMVNPQGYTLNLVPDFRVYDPDGRQVFPNNESVRWENDPNIRRSVTVVQTSETTALLEIFHGIIGELYDIQLDVSMGDGSRIFESFTDIPPIVFNTMLTGPRNLGLYAKPESDNPDIWYPYAQWDITQLDYDQLDYAHPGINKITLLFQEEIENAEPVSANFTYERFEESGEKVWRLTSASGFGDLVSTLRIMEPDPRDFSFTRFEVRFPMPIIDDFVKDIKADINELEPQFINPVTFELQSRGKDNDTKKELVISAYSAYNYTVKIYDQYGLDATAGFNSGPLANETTILKDLVVRDLLTKAVINEGFYVPGFVNYSMDIPYDIGTVEVLFELSDDFPGQVVVFSDTKRDFDVPQGGKRHINFTVSYGNDDPTPYVLTVTRLSPARDSTVANIYAATSAGIFNTMPAFERRNTGQAYTIYVPSTVNEIILYAELPEMDPEDEGYNSTLWPQGTKIPSIVSLDVNSQIRETENDRVNGSFKRVDGKWTLPLSPATSSNMFTIIVQPEAGPSSNYTVMVVRAPQTSDPFADLSGIRVTANNNAVALSPDFSGRDTESYTANVSNYFGPNVTVTAAVRDSRARVTNIRTPGIADSLPILVSGNEYSANLSGLLAGGSYPVTITVVAPDGVSRRDYHVLVNRMLPASNGLGISWVEKHREIELRWDPVSLGAGVPGSVSYELYYHTEDIGNLDNITSTAAKWQGSPVPQAGKVFTAVQGLVNARRYYFWLRAMNGNVPGEWLPIGTDTVIQPRSNNAYLSSLSVSDADIFSPAFAWNQGAFAAVVPSNVGTVTVSAAGMEAGTDATGEVYPIITYSAADTPAGTGNASGPINLPGGRDVIVRVQAHDTAVAARNYSLTIHNRLPAPSWAAIPLQKGKETNNQVTLNWNPVSGAGYYEVYYHTELINNPAGVILEAQRFTGTFTGTSCIISLENAVQHYFWVRAVQTGIPLLTEIRGELSDALPGMAKSDIAVLSNITISGGIPIEPFAFSPAQFSYTDVIVPSSVNRITIAGIRGEPNQTLRYPDGGYMEPGPGGSGTIKISVESHDELNTNEYSVTVNQMLPGPEWSAAPLEAPGQATLNWGWGEFVPPSGPAIRYEVYYQRRNTPPASPPPRIITINDSNNIRGYVNNISGNTLPVSGLDNGQYYYFWVRAVINGVYGEWSDVASAVPKNNVADFITIGVSGYSLSPSFGASPTDSYWVVVPYQEGTATVIAERVENSFQEITASIEGGSIVNIVDDNNTGSRIQYHISLSAITPTVLSLTPRSQDNNAARTYKITLHEQPASPVFNPSATIVGHDYVTLSWDAAVGAELYELYYSLNSNISGNTDFPAGARLWNANIGELNARVTSLDAADRYYFYLRSKKTVNPGGTIYSEGWTTIPVDSHKANITIIPFVLPGDISERIDADSSFNWATDEIIIEASGLSTGYDLQWYKDNILIAGETSETLKIMASDFSIARHTVTLRLTSKNDGAVYSKSVTFSVVR